MREKVFLLGGYDLEMQTIKELLEQMGIKYYDKHLSWNNATLNQYENELERYGNNAEFELYGIELQEKDAENIPMNYYRVDHHNDYSKKKSSLEQTAEILNVRLSWFQQLVAANDKGYIPAMQQSGASEKEIEKIRRQDRQTQGVTENDELLAEKAIEEKIMENGIIVVKSETNRFSPITDGLFPYEKLLIYTDDELMYYGKGKNLLVKHFEKEINSGKMFHGGGDEGFIGVAQNAHSIAEISELKNKIVELIKN